MVVVRRGRGGVKKLQTEGGGGRGNKMPPPGKQILNIIILPSVMVLYMKGNNIIEIDF